LALVKKKDASLTIRLSSDTKSDLRAAARDLDRTANWLAVNILERWLAKRHKRKR
jgi:predicted transcriptional regulator